MIFSCVRLAGVLGCLSLLVLACGGSGKEVPTLAPTTVLPTLVISTETPTETLTPTPSETPIPISTVDEPTLPPATTEVAAIVPTIEPVQLPTSTAYPIELYLNDQWEQIEVPNVLAGGLDENWLAFANFNDSTQAQATISPIAQNQDLYIARPDNRQRIKIGEIPFTAGDRVFWSPTGMQLAYFVEEGLNAEGVAIGGLYMLDFQIGLRYRLFGMRNLNPRGIPGHLPTWSADGSRLAIVLPTDYATDIFMLNADGTSFRNLTNHGSYDLYPSFSPDGLWLAFVSDRAQCPTWTPNEAQTCDTPNAAPPTQGNLFILNLNTGELRQLTDVLLNGKPTWVSNTQLAFSTGGGSALANSSDLWLVDITAGSAVQINPTGTLAFSERWSDDASRVIYQQAGQGSGLVLADNLGRGIATNTEYTFPRFGMAADWSPSGEYLAIGGRNGQCPYGILVVDPNFELITQPARNLLACDPHYAPAGRYLAFTAIQPNSRTDGRLDIYVANLNGLGASIVTSNLQGQIRLLGWVGIATP